MKKDSSDSLKGKYYIAVFGKVQATYIITPVVIKNNTSIVNLIEGFFLYYLYIYHISIIFLFIIGISQ